MGDVTERLGIEAVAVALQRCVRYVIPYTFGKGRQNAVGYVLVYRNATGPGERAGFNLIAEVCRC